MKVEFLGRLQDAAGVRETRVELPPAIRDAAGVRRWLGETIPALRDERVRVAVNDELAAGATMVCNEDNVAFLPPVSGG